TVQRRQLRHAAVLRTACHADSQAGSHGFDIGSLVHVCLHLCGQATSGPATAVAATLAKRAAKMHNGRMFDWDDLRHLIAVSRQGSTLAAAKTLGVNQSTVHRRLLELEKAIGLTLMKRHPSGYRLTELGEALIDHVLAVETAVRTLEQQIRALKLDLKGVVRLTCPEPTVPRIAATGLLDRFHERYPGLRVEFVTSDRYLDLGRGEAD